MPNIRVGISRQIRIAFRRKCWALGAFTANAVTDPNSTHLIVPKECRQSVEIVCYCVLFHIAFI